MGSSQLKLLQIVAELPSLQSRISRHSSCHCPVDELIVDRVFERVSDVPPRISVLISVDDNRTAGPCSGALSGLINQNLPVDDFEVILVDACESASFVSDLSMSAYQPQCHMQLRALRVVPGGRSLAHNVALRLARGKVVVFLGDDFVPPETFLNAHLKFHETNPDLYAVGVAAGVLPNTLRNVEFRRWLEDSGTLFGIACSAFRSQLPANYFYVGNSSMKRELIDRVGYFDEDFRHHSWDDYEMSRRLDKIGARSMFVAGAECFHVHALTLKERSATMKDAGGAACVFDCKYPGVKEWHAQLALAPAEHRWKAILGMSAYLVFGDRKLQHRYWTRLLMANFVEGYLEKLRTLVEL